MSQRIEILTVGDTQWALRSACKEIDARWRDAATVDEALSLLTVGAFDLIVLNCGRRGVFRPDDILRLARCAPLSRIAAVTSPWCEGPWRRGPDLLPGASLVPWHRFRPWLRASAGEIRRGLPAAWSLPQTSAADEMAEFWSRARVPQAQGLIVIETASRDAAEAIRDALALAGYAASWHGGAVDGLVSGAAAIVVEANGWDGTLEGRVRDLRKPEPQTPIFLLLNFPLPADIAAANAAGASAVLGKPFTLGEFWGQLRELIPPSRIAAGEAA